VVGELPVARRAAPPIWKDPGMPASPSTARAINDRLALRLLQQEGPLTAAQLKQLTGLSRPSVADLVDRLTAAGLITVVGESGEQRRGPNAKLYGIVADRAHLAAVDLRTEGVAVAVSDLLGRVLAEASVPIGDDTGTGPAVEQAVTLVERVAKEAGADRLHTVGIGAPGLIDPTSGELRDSSGLPEWHRRLVAALQERLPGARVSVENETNLAALAEQRDGAARDRDTFVLLWLGMGIGAAVVLDGQLRRGASGGAGEIGFLPVPGTTGLPSATDCGGGFHSLAAAGAVARLAAQHGVTATAAPHEPPAAALVRAAVEAVVSRAAQAAGDGSQGPAAAGQPAHRGTPVDAGRKGVGAGRGSMASGLVSVPDVGSGAAPDVGPVAAAPGADADSVASDFGVGSAVPGRGGGSAVVRPGSGAAPDEGPVAAAPGAHQGSEPVPDAAPSAAASGSGQGPAVVAHPSGPVRAAPQAVPAPVPPQTVPNAAADRFLDTLADRVALGAAAVISVLDPGCVVLAGEIGRAGGDALARRVQDRLERLSPLPTQVRASTLGGGAVLRGALLTARAQAQDELFEPPER
jgi:predicted NBD/HSP70 family sugar kinase